ncbi:MAG: DUF1127 domain-containing protein [Alphaproteobacteria bacterium]
MFHWLIGRAAAWRARREQRRALAAVDCHTLQDVGLNHVTVMAALLGGTLLTRHSED